MVLSFYILIIMLLILVCVSTYEIYRNRLLNKRDKDIKEALNELKEYLGKR